jgi:hypothetical protein
VILRDGWSADALLGPHNEHPYLGPIVVYKLLLAVFGMDSTLPFRLVNLALLIGVAWLVMVFVRSRLGPWPALIAAALLLFLGPAWEDLLWPAGISFLGSMAAGLGALALLDRERTREAWVCALLVVSLCFSSLGLVFAAGVAVDVALRGRGGAARARLARAWVPAVPVVLYAVWFLAYGHEAQGNASLDNLLGIPLYAWTAAAAVLASLLGLVQVDPTAAGAVVSFDWGKPLLVAGLVGAGILIARDPRVISQRLWVLAATAAVFWASAGLNQVPGREPGASRYQLIGAVLVILIAAELLRGRRLGRGGLWVAAALAALAVVSNIGALRNGERFLREQSDTARAELTALELAREAVDPGFVLSSEVTETPYLAPIVAGPYFEAVDRDGSPVDSPGDLLEASEENRGRADRLLASALGVSLEPATGSGEGCERLDPSGELAVPPEGSLIEPIEGPTTVLLRRFAEDTYPVELGPASGASALRIAADDSTQPWTLGLDAPARICPLPPG